MEQNLEKLKNRLSHVGFSITKNKMIPYEMIIYKSNDNLSVGFLNILNGDITYTKEFVISVKDKGREFVYKAIEDYQISIMNKDSKDGNS